MRHNRNIHVRYLRSSFVVLPVIGRKAADAGDDARREGPRWLVRDGIDGCAPWVQRMKEIGKSFSDN